MKNLKIKDIAKRIGHPSNDERKITGYYCDSREVKEGAFFFALPGQKRDGHEFLKEISEKGAYGALVSNNYKGPEFGLTLLKVEDVLSSLQKLANALLEESRTKIAAVTGSLGKTTTKDFVFTLLEKKFRASKSPMNKNTQVSLPLSLLNREGNEEFMVLEMGMTLKGHIQKLTTIAPPDYSMITMVSVSHMEFFPTGAEGIAEAKAEILTSKKTQKVLIPYDFLQYPHLIRDVSAKIYTFSQDKAEADFFLSEREGKFIISEKEKESPPFSLPFPEKHFIYDAFAAICFCRVMGLSYKDILPRLSELKTPSMRFEKVEKKGVLFINDAYNAAPLSMRMALSQMPEPKNGGKKIAVLGEMRELGPITDESHREIGRFALNFVDHLLCLGEKCAWACKEFESGGKKAELFLSHEALLKKLREIVTEKDVVLLKGSRIMGMEKILELF